MRVFVAGATGVLGRLVVRELQARGHGVVGLARSAGNEAILRWLGATPAPGDLFDADSLDRATRGAEVVMHLATAIPTVRRPTLADWRLNDRILTEGTANLLDAACRVRARFYVQQSVTLVHGSAGESWIDEGSPVVPHRVADAAATMERLVREAAKLHRLPAAILRAGTMYHEESSGTRELIARLKAGKQPIVGMGSNFRSMIQAEDMARACVLAAEMRPVGETFLVVDDEPVRWRDVATRLARAVGGPRPHYLPPFAARLALGNLQVDLEMASLRCRNGKLKRQLGWQPRYPTYREGVAATLASSSPIPK
jgi:nucleoside-diphosphate-sugar epimerase